MMTNNEQGTKMCKLFLGFEFGYSTPVIEVELIRIVGDECDVKLPTGAIVTVSTDFIYD